MHTELNRKVAIIGAPLALGQSLTGVSTAPQALRQGGLREAITELGCTVTDNGDLIWDEASLTKSSSGSAATAVVTRVRNAQAVGQACQKIAREVEKSARQGAGETPAGFTLTLGGDHSIALGSISGILRARPETALVWVDAHGDFNTPGTSPSGNLHGMPLAALLGYTAPALPGFEWLQEGPNAPRLTPDRVALVGVRSLDKAERELLREAGVHVYTMATIDRYGIGPVMERAINSVNPEGQLDFHVSFDIDAMDPHEAPGTGTKSRGGLTYREGHTILEMLAATGKLNSMDLVEINPELDQDDMTISLGIELVCSALGKAIF